MALEALRGELTTAQLAAKHGIHQTMVDEWKRQAVEGMAGVFSGKSAAQESAKAAEADVEKLHAKIGQLLVEAATFLRPVAGKLNGSVVSVSMAGVARTGCAVGWSRYPDP